MPQGKSKTTTAHKINFKAKPEVDALKTDIDHLRIAKKDTPYPKAKKNIQKLITMDSTNLSKEGYPNYSKDETTIKKYSEGTKKMKIGKYADGTKGIFSKSRREESAKAAEAIDAQDSMENKPKKMGFFSKLKAKQDAGNSLAESIDAEDYKSSAKSEVQPLTTKESKLDLSKRPSTNENMFVGPKQTGLDAEMSSKQSDDSKLDSISSSKTKTPLNNGSLESVKQWQAKRGLKADGIWGNTSGPNKSETQKAYEKEQASKFSKKMNLGKAPKGTVTTDNYSYKPGIVDKGFKSSTPSEIKEVQRQALVKQLSKKNPLEEIKSYPRVKGKSYASEKKTPSKDKMNVSKSSTPVKYEVSLLGGVTKTPKSYDVGIFGATKKGKK